MLLKTYSLTVLMHIYATNCNHLADCLATPCEILHLAGAALKLVQDGICISIPWVLVHHMLPETRNGCVDSSTCNIEPQEHLKRNGH